MGRGKIELKRIEKAIKRQVTYSKRKNGIIKKAKEIDILCDTQISMIIISGDSRKMDEYVSPSTTLIDILERYQNATGKMLWDTKHENLNNEIDRIKRENDNLKIQLSHFKGENITSLTIKELGALEEALENGRKGVREKMSEVHKTLTAKLDTLRLQEHYR